MILFVIDSNVKVFIIHVYFQFYKHLRKECIRLNSFRAHMLKWQHLITDSALFQFEIVKLYKEHISYPDNELWEFFILKVC